MTEAHQSMANLRLKDDEHRDDEQGDEPVHYPVDVLELKPLGEEVKANEIDNAKQQQAADDGLPTGLLDEAQHHEDGERDDRDLNQVPPVSCCPVERLLKHLQTTVPSGTTLAVPQQSNCTPCWSFRLKFQHKSLFLNGSTHQALDKIESLAVRSHIMHAYHIH